MNIFDTIQKDVLARFSSWIQVNDDNTHWTIEDFSYETGVIEEVVKPHCVKCVAVNQCWFKNEKNKKPDAFDYSKYTFEEIPLLKRGLYHPNCHCKERRISAPHVGSVSVIIPENKKKYLFSQKLGWLNYMGYEIETSDDKKRFLKLYSNIVKNAFIKSDYYKEDLNKYGFKINIKMTFPGEAIKKGENFMIEGNFMIFPKGKLKLNTPIGGWAK